MPSPAIEFVKLAGLSLQQVHTEVFLEHCPTALTQATCVSISPFPVWCVLLSCINLYHKFINKKANSCFQAFCSHLRVLIEGDSFWSCMGIFVNIFSSHLDCFYVLSVTLKILWLKPTKTHHSVLQLGLQKRWDVQVRAAGDSY